LWPESIKLEPNLKWKVKAMNFVKKKVVGTLVPRINVENVM
jgi:hypothetical protein